MMNFDEKIKNCIDNFTLIDRPDYASHEYNFYVDFIELVAIFSMDKMVAIGDIADRFFGTKDYDKAEQRDKDEKWLKFLFEILEERRLLFGLHYPFILREEKLLEMREELTWKNEFYIYLLIASKLNIFKDFKAEITTEFERVSSVVLRNFLPSNAIIKEFGKNSEYKGNAKNKIKALSQDLGLDNDNYELDSIPERNNQERGLDIIGWVPFEDNCMNKLVYLAQCACGKDTESKYHDTRRFKNYLKFYKTKPQHLLFIPYSLINTRAQKFYGSDLIEDDFLILERKRIVYLFNQEEIFQRLDSFEIVNNLIKFKEDIV